MLQMTLHRPSEPEYAVAREGTVFVRLPRGIVRGEGSDRLDLLHRLSTNATRELEAGGETTTILTTDKGRILEVVRVVAFADHLLMILSGTDAERVRAWLDKYTIMDDFRTADVSADHAVFGVYGMRSRSTVSLAIGPDLPDAGQFRQSAVEGHRVVVMRDTRLGGAGGFLLVADAAGADLVAARLAEAGAQELGADTYETLRIEAGQPAVGRELSESYNPLEAGLVQLVSFTKGCYIGQEVIARLDSYDKVQRHLVGLLIEGSVEGELPELTVHDAVDGAAVGAVTSVAFSPTLGHAIALAYVRTQHAIPGAEVWLAPSEGADETARLRATITKLPFDR
jgi:folate-binding protein YgfZ